MEEPGVNAKSRKLGQCREKVAASALPSLDELEKELHRVRYRERYKTVLKSTLALLVVAAAAAVLVVTLWMPVLRVCGNSMAPTLEDGEIVVLTKSLHFQTGDMMAFYYNNKILIKRVIAQSGDWVEIEGSTAVRMASARVWLLPRSSLRLA